MLNRIRSSDLSTLRMWISNFLASFVRHSYATRLPSGENRSPVSFISSVFRSARVIGLAWPVRRSWMNASPVLASRSRMNRPSDDGGPTMSAFTVNGTCLRITPGRRGEASSAARRFCASASVSF